MSHLIEEYAKNLGVKIGNKPIMMEHFWPLPFDKYIVINAGAEVPSKTYKHFNLVLDMLVTVLSKHEIHIVQVGAAQDAKLKNISLRLVDLHPRQMAYIVSKSLLYLGSDCVWSHYANSKNVATVTLHGNAYAAISNGAWNDNQINLEGKWEVCPSLSGTDPHSSINKITPEEISAACCKMLNIEYKNSLSTLHIGDTFGQAIVEVIPDFSPNLQIENDYAYFLRCDFTENNFLEDWCYHLPAFSAFIDKKTNLNILARHQHKIQSLLFEVSDDHESTKVFLDAISKLSKNIVLIADKKRLNKMRNKWFNYKVLPKTPENTTKLDSHKNLFLASSKMVIDKNGAYASLYHRKRRISGVMQLLPITKDEELFNEIEHFVIFEKSA